MQIGSGGCAQYQRVPEKKVFTSSSFLIIFNPDSNSSSGSTYCTSRHLLSSASLHTHTLIYSESLCAGVAVSFRRDRLHFGALHSSSNSQTGTHLLKKYSFAISYTNSALSPSISLLETRCALPLLLTLLCPDLIRASPIADWLSVTI